MIMEGQSQLTQIVGALERATAARTFCTAGRRSPINNAIMAITTSTSTRVYPFRVGKFVNPDLGMIVLPVGIGLLKSWVIVHDDFERELLPDSLSNRGKLQFECFVNLGGFRTDIFHINHLICFSSPRYPINSEGNRF